MAVAVTVMPAKAYEYEYIVDTRPVFQQIADLEQERILLQLERERVQLVLDLDRMAAEQARIRSDMDRLSGVGNEEVQRLERENAQMQAMNDRLNDRIDSLEERLREAREAAPAAQPAARGTAVIAPTEITEPEIVPISQRFRLIEIIGIGRQLQASIEDLSTGQRRRVTVGRVIDGYEVQSISLYDGIIFVRDGVTESLTLGSRQ